MARALSICTITLLTLAQLGTSVGVIAIVALHLANVNTWGTLFTFDAKECLMGPDSTNVAPCNYGIAVGAISVVLVVIIGILQLVTCNMCGCGAVLDLVFTGVGVAWWLAASLVLSSVGAQANNRGLPANNWRVAVIILSWATMGLFGALFLVHMIRVGYKVCNCCGRKRGQMDAVDTEKALMRPDQAPRPQMALHREMRAKYGVGSAGQYASGPGYVQGSAPI